MLEITFSRNQNSSENLSLQQTITCNLSIKLRAQCVGVLFCHFGKLENEQKIRQRIFLVRYLVSVRVFAILYTGGL